MKNKKFGNIQLYDYKPTIIAEAGVNHNCNLNLAKEYIDLASKGGANAIKFQTYQADKLVSKTSLAYWDTKKEKIQNQYELFKKYEKFNFSDYSVLHNYCLKKKILFMTTLFDTESIDKYNKLINIYKISSSDITNVPLLKAISKKKKHTIISTGASTIDEIITEEINFVFDAIDSVKNKCLIIQKCRRLKLPFIIVGGAGQRIDPSLIEVKDLNRTINDKLLFQVRKMLRREFGYSKNTKRIYGIPSVYSKEVPMEIRQNHCEFKSGKVSNCESGLGSAGFVTSTFASVAVSYAFRKLSE